MMTPSAKARMSATLRPREAIAALASWPDEIRLRRKDTEPWHFVNIEITRSGLDMTRDCSHNNCVVAKITDFRKLWRDGNASRRARREALLFLVHFVGDLHEPLHCADNHDRGGNNLHVAFFGEVMNLHKVWDADLLNRLGAEDALFRTLSRAITPDKRTEWSAGTIEDWAGESFRAAKDVVYGDLPDTPRGGIPQLGEAYERAADPVVEQQIEKAGVRLAAILNETP
jgi:hypothetical protein